MLCCLFLQMNPSGSLRFGCRRKPSFQPLCFQPLCFRFLCFLPVAGLPAFLQPGWLVGRLPSQLPLFLPWWFCGHGSSSFRRLHRHLHSSERFSSLFPCFVPF